MTNKRNFQDFEASRILLRFVKKSVDRLIAKSAAEQEAKQPDLDTVISNTLKRQFNNWMQREFTAHYIWPCGAEADVLVQLQTHHHCHLGLITATEQTENGTEYCIEYRQKGFGQKTEMWIDEQGVLVNKKTLSQHTPQVLRVLNPDLPQDEEQMMDMAGAGTLAALPTFAALHYHLPFPKSKRNELHQQTTEALSKQDIRYHLSVLDEHLTDEEFTQSEQGGLDFLLSTETGHLAVAQGLIEAAEGTVYDEYPLER